MDCEECGETLGGSPRSDARYCSGACRQRSYRRRLSAELGGFGDPDADRAVEVAEIINGFREMVQHYLDPENVSTFSPKAQDLLIRTFEDAIRTIRNASASVTANDRG